MSYSYDYLTYFFEIRDYLRSYLPDDEYSVGYDENYIRIIKDMSVLLLKLDFSIYDPYNSGIIMKIYFFTYEISHYVESDEDEWSCERIKKIPFSKNEEFFILSDIKNERLISTYYSQDRIKLISTYIKRIFEFNEQHPSFLYKLDKKTPSFLYEIK